MRQLNRLTAMEVRNAAVGKHSDGGGLSLFKRKDGGGQWILRVSIHGRRREMGLGSVQHVPLKEARETADKYRAMVRVGVDPIKERERQRREALRDSHLLNDIAVEAFEARKAELKGDGKAGRWYSPLELHVLPKLSRVPVTEIDQRNIRDALAPIWHTKAETAKKALDRLGLCLQHAAALGLNVDLQATQKARALLGKSRQERRNIPSLPWQDVPEFYASLLEETTVKHLALRLLILTAARSGEVRFCHVDEILDDVWTIPAERMKAGQEHPIPLSQEAMRALEAARPFARDGFFFPGVRKGVISDATMSRMMERRSIEARPHGFRSSFRTWCAEQTEVPQGGAETALAHITGNRDPG